MTILQFKIKIKKNMSNDFFAKLFTDILVLPLLTGNFLFLFHFDFGQLERINLFKRSRKVLSKPYFKLYHLSLPLFVPMTKKLRRKKLSHLLPQGSYGIYIFRRSIPGYLKGVE